MSYDIQELLQKAYRDQASDLHISVDSPPVFRRHGKLLPYGEIPLSAKDTESMARSLVPAADWEHLLDNGEIDLSYSLGDTVRFRLNVYMERGRFGFAARVVPAAIPTFDQLNLPEVLKDLTKKPHGLILVTGPTGSGKSTTLAAMIDYINQHEHKHIVTLEDPIEYMHQHRMSIIHQREIGSDTKSFSAGLRAALRQDPDVILVGEMRDLETISTAITAAETGHLVMATLHTNHAPQTINRIIDVFPSHQQKQIRIQLASVLAGIISQRLFAKADGTGRVAATEILLNYPSIANLIRNEKVEQIHNMMQTGRSRKMHTMEMAVQSLRSSGLISAESARPYVPDMGGW